MIQLAKDNVQNVANSNEATLLDQAATNAKKLVDALGFAAEKVREGVCVTLCYTLFFIRMV